MSEVAIAAQAILAGETAAARTRREGGTSVKIGQRSRALEATASRWGKSHVWLDWVLKTSAAAAADPERFGAVLGFLDSGGAPNVAWGWVQANRDGPRHAVMPLPPAGRCAPLRCRLDTWRLSDVDVAARALLDSTARLSPANPGIVPLDPGARSSRDLRLVASLWGRGADWLRDILDVCAAAAAQPDRFGFLVPVMDDDKGKSASRAFRRMDRILDIERVRMLRPAAGKFRTLVMDVPWREDNVSEGTDHGYAQLSFEEILALKDQVLAWAADDFCHLWFWYKNNTIALACQAVLHFGFTIKSNHTWAKPRWGQGRYARNNSEHILFAIRGDTGCKPAYMGTPTVHPWPYPSGPESSKPDGFYEMVRALSHEPYGEAFQRTPRPDFANLYEATAAMNEAAE